MACLPSCFRRCSREPSSGTAIYEYLLLDLAVIKAPWFLPDISVNSSTNCSPLLLPGAAYISLDIDTSHLSTFLVPFHPG
jgi:hypothetical protein